MKVGRFLKFILYAKGYLARFPKERSQLTLALQNKFINKYKKFVEEIERRQTEKKDELEAVHCLKDKETGAFVEKEVIVGGQVIFKKSFTAQADKKRREEYDKFEKELFDEDVPDFKEYFVDIPKNIDITWVNEFSGILFNPMSEEEELNWYLAQEQPEKKEPEKKG